MQDASIPAGFHFAGISSGIKAAAGALDIALFATTNDSIAAGVYTQNRVRAASVIRNERITPTPNLRAVVINSGNANACTGQRGNDDNEKMAAHLASALNCQPEQVLVLSTGIIGQYLPMEKVLPGLTQAATEATSGAAAFSSASRGMLTTDKGPKTLAKSCQIAGQSIRFLGAAKGAGMIGPNMATMLAVIMTDAALQPDDAQRLLKKAADVSFNCISVEGHTSTSDSAILICSGAASSAPLTGDALDQFSEELDSACIELAKQIPSDGEGASHLVEIHVTGCTTQADARRIARTIAHSALVKTAISGNDPNWGRIVSAAGYADVPFTPEQTRLRINGREIFSGGQPTDFDEHEVSTSMAERFETIIEFEVGQGTEATTFWTSDLTAEYVRINADYHT